ncbi:MAG TPA: hypothetical protein VJJ26_05560 [Candidatus Babeliales bacterium]|nr:hypothetical protein [Candidatus Babeliales bacterium]
MKEFAPSVCLTPTIILPKEIAQHIFIDGILEDRNHSRTPLQISNYLFKISTINKSMHTYTHHSEIVTYIIERVINKPTQYEPLCQLNCAINMKRKQSIELALTARAQPSFCLDTLVQETLELAVQPQYKNIFKKNMEILELLCKYGAADFETMILAANAKNNITDIINILDFGVKNANIRLSSSNAKS